MTTKFRLLCLSAYLILGTAQAWAQGLGYEAGAISTDLSKWYRETDLYDNMQVIADGDNSNGCYAFKNYVIDGKPYKYGVFGDAQNHSHGSHGALPQHINNDDAMDFYSYPVNSSSYRQNADLHMAYENGGMKKITLNNTDYRNVAIPVDYNNDGLTDFLVGEEIWEQGANSTFVKHKLNVMSHEVYENGYAKAYNPTLVSPGMFNPNTIGSGFSICCRAVPSAYVQLKGSKQLQNIDIDGNGLPDLLNTVNGELWLSLGNDNYVREQLGGSILFRDLNGDGLLDYITYDSEAKEVVAQIRQEGGAWKAETLMSNLSMDNQIWACDYDRDGDVDIIMPFSYSESNNASFLVVMVNDGNGNFTMKENSYPGRLKFMAFADIDNDGYYDVLAIRVDEYGVYGKSAVWLKGDAQYKFTLQVQDLFTVVENDISDFAVADINNDGKYELIVNNQYSANSVYPINISSTVCQAPAKPAKPEFAYETSSGYLKVSWQPAVDNRYPAVDLTYELRIGTTPGKGDMVYACAYADGTRRNLLDGNMGYSLDRLIDVSGWNTGDYYISIQAINPMRRGSAFSDEAVFSKKQPSAKFALSDEQAAVDTLTIALLGSRDPSLKYLWNLDGGKVIESNADSTVMKLKYTLPGAKKITLQTRNIAGDLSPVCERETYLFANKITPAFRFEPHASPVAFADLDNCGKLEALTPNGIYANDGNGNFTKVDKIFNTNLVLGENSRLFDYSNNGVMDLFNQHHTVNNYNVSVYKNTSTVGDFNFSMSPENLGYTYSLTMDWNNDGKTDAIENDMSGWGNYKLQLNNGDYKSFTAKEFGFDVYHSKMIDLNKDGFMDAILVDAMDGGDGVRVVQMLNDGKGNFTRKEFLTTLKSTTSTGYPEYKYSYLLADVNSDGYIDLLAASGNIIQAFLNHKNESFEPEGDLVVPITELKRSKSDSRPGAVTLLYAYDFDNNGYLDVVFEYAVPNWAEYGYKRGILYFYENLDAEYYENNNLPYAVILADVDNDGVQDIPFGANSYYGYQGYKNSSTVVNASPSAPANIRWTQTDESLLIEWDAATDAESPATMLRYNLSVKRQGATGDNAYVISPLNDRKNNMQPVSLKDYPYNPYYHAATRMEIPLTAFAVGTNYEIQIQTLDEWNAVSDFSVPVVAKVVSNPQIKVSASVCAQIPATIEYKGTGTPIERVWNWDGGRLLNTNGNFYEVVWDTPGAKNISVTVSSVTNEAAVQVLQPVSTIFSIPEQVLAGVTLNIPLQNAQVDYDLKWYYNSNSFIYSYPPMTIIPPGVAPSWKVNAVSNTAALTFPQEGCYTLQFTVAAPCGTAESNWYQVHVSNMIKPEITLVTVNGSKNEISWTVPGGLPGFVTGINVYKEGAKYNDFRLEASLPLTQTSYIDPYSNTNMMVSRYRIAWATTFGESQPGTPHKGIHLMINKGAGNSWNLYWGQYEGAMIESFKIMRGTTPENLSLLAEISGSNASFTDMTPPSGHVYYAVEYDRAYTLAAGMRTAQATPPGHSNVVCTSDAFHAVLATSISIDSRDELTPSQPGMYMIANIMPGTATYQAAGWTIISGGELAAVDSYGRLALTGAGNGHVVVKAATIDGSNLSTQKTIRIKDVITSLSIRTDRDILTATENNTHLYADILPIEMAGSDIEWSISEKTPGFDVQLGGNYLTVSNIVVGGYITVRATTTNGSGMYAEKTLLTSATVGLPKIEIPDSKLTIYPNPVINGRLIVLYSGSEEQIRIYDLVGNLKLVQPVNAMATEINISNLSEGVYVLMVGNDRVKVIKR